MKKIMMLLFLILLSTVSSFGQSPSQVNGGPCRIVDMVAKKGSEVDYVDGKRVPGNLVTIDYLRAQEKVSPTNCLSLFVTIHVRIEDIEGMWAIAGKMQYKDFHVYVYNENQDLVSEIRFGEATSPDEVRKGPNGAIPWPDDPNAEPVRHGQRQPGDVR